MQQAIFTTAGSYPIAVIHAIRGFAQARAKLEALRQVEQQYQAALQRQQQLGSGSIAAGTMTTAMASPMVDKRMYDQLAASRQRISQKLSETNLYIKYLEGRVEKGDEGMVKVGPGAVAAPVTTEAAVIVAVTAIVPDACLFCLVQHHRGDA